jgi:PAS domain S-box-containing protein
LSKFEVEIINVEELELITRDEREKLADLILLDLSEKEEEGLEMLAKAKLNPEKIPVIVIGETRDENFGIECMRKGVQEFITKSHLTESILSTAIVHTIERHRFSQESKKKVQRTYDFLREVFNKIEDPVFVKDTKHQWILWNKSFREFLRLSEEEILRRSDIDFFSPEEVDVFWKNDDLVIKTGEVNTSEEVISFGEEQKIISTKKSRFIDRNGEKFLIGLIRDVTDYKRLIKQEEEARKEAERANKVKDNFLAIVSHELKNPLTAILCLTKYSRLQVTRVHSSQCIKVRR